MAKRKWTFILDKLEGNVAGEFKTVTQQHTLELHHNYWSCGRKIYLDGRLVPRDEMCSFGYWGLGSDDLFLIGGHSCLVHIRTNGALYMYDVAINGKSLKNGDPVQAYLQVVTPRDAARRLPIWGYGFMFLCLVVALLVAVIPFKLLPELPHQVSGFVPVGVAMGAVFGILNAAKDLRKSLAQRVLACLGVVSCTALAVLVLDMVAVAIVLAFKSLGIVS